MDNRRTGRRKGSARRAEARIGTMDEVLRQRLEVLGWTGVPFLTVFAHMVWQYLAARLDVQVPLRVIEDRDVPDPDQAEACCERAAVAMIDEAKRAGRLDLLHRPYLREPEEMLSVLQQVFGT